jgi:hypothetical protein
MNGREREGDVPPATPPTIAPVLFDLAPTGLAVVEITVPGAMMVVTETKVVNCCPSEVIL